MFLRQSKKHSFVESLDKPINANEEDNSPTEIDQLADLNAEFEKKVINAMYNEKVKAAVEKILTPKEFTVISYRYGFAGDPKMQKEIGDILGISRSYISRIELAALKKLREELDKNISEVAEYRYKIGDLDLNSIHEELTTPIFKKILSLFPEDEKSLYIKKFGEIEFCTEEERKQITRIENNIRELFLYYLDRKNKKMSKEEAMEKVKSYGERHFLRLRYKEVSYEKIKSAIEQLTPRFQMILYQRYGKDLLSYHEFVEDKYRNSTLLSLAHKKLKEELERVPIKIHPKSLRAIYPDLSYEELEQTIAKLPKNYQDILYLRHGKTLEEYNPFPKNRDSHYNHALYFRAKKALERKLSKEETEERKTVLNTYKREDLLYALPLIPEIIQKSIYLRHGKNLDRTTAWKEIEVPEDRPMSIYRQNYYRSYNFIDGVLKQRKLLKEQAQKTAITKLNEYSILEIKEALQELSIEEQNVIFLKHGESLTEFKPWPTNHSLLYYKDIYNKAIIHLKDILRKKKNNNETSELPKDENMAPAPIKVLEIPSENRVKKSKKKKKKKQHKQQVKLATERNALTNQKDLLKEAKEINVKTELYNEFYELYGDLIGEIQLKSIVKESVDSYNQEENIDILYASKFKIESEILLLLANKYKENPESEEALTILIRINHIFTKKMKERYPHMDEGKIEWAIESALNSYVGNKTFSVEVMKRLRGFNKKS